MTTAAPYETRLLPFGDAAIVAATGLIQQGQPVAIPTETVYGLAADATDAPAVARIYAAKGRPDFNPLIVHVLDLTAAERLALFDDRARALAAAFWPGPLTLVLPQRPGNGIASVATAGLATIALRVPAHPAMRALLGAADRPLAAPSANASGRISPTRAEHVLKSLGGRIPLVIDGGPSAAGLESTILNAAGDVLTLLRPGPITAAEIAARTGLSLAAADDAPIVAPGQLASHYAPAKPLRLDAVCRAHDEWLIGFGEIAGDDTLSAAGSLIEAAACLFDALHRADAAAPARIAIAPIPGGGLGLAINDRLRRAATR
jgi:L-threonylcarbamoyladenylate synthase